MDSNRAGKCKAMLVIHASFRVGTQKNQWKCLLFFFHFTCSVTFLYCWSKRVTELNLCMVLFPEYFQVSPPPAAAALCMTVYGREGTVWAFIGLLYCSLAHDWHC